MWIGIILVVSSICGLFFWETKGRECFLMDQVFVAAERIPMGTEVNTNQFKLVYVLRENKVEEAFSKEDKSRLQGKVTAQIIEKNQQVTADTFCKKHALIEEGKSVFLIKPEWIDSRSSSLRRGDWVDFYLAESGTFVGYYPVAFVKDEKEREVRNEESIMQDYILERTDATAQISHIEIIAALSEYEGIRHMAEESSEGFLLVQAKRKEE
ncbi:hypothetical protein [Anaerovorax sp. IOR16]|uniref:hypothetical protein n=1 Tax=Anaerovorax sp. IOR16 TaxID=2773458 RepID=UPI0019D155C5|nr:hypothetical protein [Anaerovorax sp. IOR16]